MARNRNKTRLRKAVFVGTGAVGKTALFNKYLKGDVDSNYQATIGMNVDVKPMSFDIDGIAYTARNQIWDLAGQERFRDFSAVYYDGVKGVFGVFDLTRIDTFTSLQEGWLTDICNYMDKEKEMHEKRAYQKKAQGRQVAPYETPILTILGNKLDLIVQEQKEKNPGISEVEVISQLNDFYQPQFQKLEERFVANGDFVFSQNQPFYFTSAFTGQNIITALEDNTRTFVDRYMVK